jgi:phosphohistidine swiveling domain-containing protein
VSQRDPLQSVAAEDSHWTRVNVGEALPGVATPLGWSIWGVVGDRMCRNVSFAMGVFDRSELDDPTRIEDRIMSVFYGRIALRMEWVAVMGDRMPGTSGAEAIGGMLGVAPETMLFGASRRRYPVIAAKLPLAMVTAPRRVRAMAAEVDAWWHSQIPVLQTASHEEAVAALRDAVDQFCRTMTIHGIGLFTAVNPLLTAVKALVEKTGVGDVGVLSGTGGAEMAMIEDIWRASRGEIDLDQIVARHGYHGPLEGEISSLVWREDPTPLHALIGHYRALDESDSPVQRDAEAARRLPLMQQAVVAARPAFQRPGARALLKLAAKTIPLRGVGKVSFLQALDVARAAARRVGQHLVADGLLGSADDVCYLTLDEIFDGIPSPAGELIAFRRARRDEYRALALPLYWRGMPEPLPLGAASLAVGDMVSGIGASSGVVQGIARVVTDPSFADVEPGEILVAQSTDPSWASIMYVSAGLVVDVGSMISHAAVVARELGLPCVVNVGTATRALRDGDVIRVDGDKGTVELLARPRLVAEV